MISYIRGELADVEENKVIVDAGGIGYGIFMSGHAIGLLPRVGSEVKIYTYLNVKEDCIQAADYGKWDWSQRRAWYFVKTDS